MSRTVMWEAADAPRTWQIAQKAARRDGMMLEEWLDEAILKLAASNPPGSANNEIHSRVRRDRTRRRRPGGFPIEEDWRSLAARRVHTRRRHLGGPPIEEDRRPLRVQDLMEAAVQRIERVLARNAKETFHALESIKLAVEASIRLRNPAQPTSESFHTRAAEPPREEEADAVARSATVDEHRNESSVSRSPRPPDESKFCLRQNARSPRVHLKEAISQIAMERQELDARDAASRAGRQETVKSRAPLYEARDASESAEPSKASDRSHLLSQSNSSAFREPRPVASKSFRDERLEREASMKADEDVCPLADKLENLSRTEAKFSANAAAIASMLAEIRRSLANLAPRNAIVGLEGAIRDLTQRVEVLRRNGHKEALLAPLNAMAAELRATLKAHNPQVVDAVVEQEIRVIRGTIDSLARSAVDLETLERVRIQTEKVRNLLAAAASRALPTERVERQISDLADRVERLSASPAPKAEVQQMASALAQLRKDIERSTPLPILASIERLKQSR